MKSVRPYTTMIRVFAISIIVLIAALDTNTSAVNSTTGKEFTY